MTDFWKIVKPENAAKKTATVYIYEDIGGYDWWAGEEGLTAKRFANELDALGKMDELVVRINSVGGSVFEARAMASLLRNFKADKPCHIDGACMSAATYLACACDRVAIAADGIYMVHNPMGICMGDANEMRDAAGQLDVILDGMLEIYSAKTGKAKEELRPIVNKETWYTGQEAVTAKFADEVTEARKMEARGKPLNSGRAPWRKLPDRLKNRVKLEMPRLAEARKALSIMRQEIR